MAGRLECRALKAALHTAPAIPGAARTSFLAWVAAGSTPKTGQAGWPGRVSAAAEDCAARVARTGDLEPSRPAGPTGQSGRGLPAETDSEQARRPAQGPGQSASAGG